MTREEFKAIRAQLCVSGQVLADKLGVSRSSINDYERGYCRIPEDIATTLRGLDASAMATIRWQSYEDRFGHDRIRQTLVANHWSVKRAAKELGVLPSSLLQYVYRHLRDEWRQGKAAPAWKHGHLYHRDVLIAAYEACGWNQHTAAQKLGVSHTTLRYISLKVIPNEMERNGLRRAGPRSRAWRANMAAGVARSKTRRVAA